MLLVFSRLGWFRRFGARHFAHFSVARKMGLVFLGLLLSSVLVSGALLWQMQRVNQSVAEATGHSERRMLGTVRWQALSNQAMEVALAGVQSSEETLIAAANDKARALWAAAEQARADVDQGLDVPSQALMRQAQAGQAGLLRHYEVAYRARDLGQAWEVQKVLDAQLLPDVKAQAAVVERFLELQEQHRRAVWQAGEAQRAQAQWWALGAFAGLLLLGLAVSALVVRSLTRPLHQAVAVARTIAQGDLRVQVSGTRSDEVGVLLHDLGRMAHQLQALVEQVREGVGAVTAASALIATGNGELAQRTTQTADHLRRSVARIEQVTLALVQTSATALQADQFATTAEASAREGRDAVGNMVQSMQAIAARSREIAAITSVIDGIAFQTNILALNAAVEAARAGPQGRGFAVVASEVRALAQRSADAAKQIKLLIADSLREVDGGVVLAQQAGNRMQGIVGDVAHVGQLIAQMAQAATTQRDDMAQIQGAVQQLDDMTHQNAGLVQASTQATAAMQREVGQLVQELGAFRLGEPVEAGFAGRLIGLEQAR